MRRLFPLLACLATVSAVRAEEDASLARYLPAETPFLFEIRTPPPAEIGASPKPARVPWAAARLSGYGTFERARRRTWRKPISIHNYRLVSMPDNR